MLFRILEQLPARSQVPFAPGRDHVDTRLQRVVAEFEAHLVVAFAGRAVTYRVGPRAACDLDLALGDQRARDGRAQQVFSLVDCIGTEHRKHEITHEFLAQVLDENFLDAHFPGLGARGCDFLTLADIGGKGNDFAVIGILQPLQDH